MKGNVGALTADRLRSLLDYDPTTGVFRHKTHGHKGCWHPGDVAGSYNPRDNTMYVSLDGKRRYLHDLAWLYVHGEYPPKQIMRLDNDGRNNRIDNLRLTSPLRARGLTVEDLRSFLDYQPGTGVFRWKVRPAKNVKIGSIAGRIFKNGYRFIAVDGTSYPASRLAWFYVNGEWPKRKLLFLDGNSDNVAIGNLAEALRRFATRSEQEKHYRKINPMKFRGIDLTKNFGITIATYQEMFVTQSGVCAICKQPETATRNGQVKWLAVDHCHDTHVVRGLLCAACNTAIGRMGDNPVRLRAAADYIEKAREAPSEGANVIRLIPRKAS